MGQRALVEMRPVISPSEGHSNVDEIRRWGPLPATADELCEVGRRLGASKNDILLGSQATKSVLKDLSKTGHLAYYRILYFATHCALTVAKPGLILTPQQEAATDTTGKLDWDDGLLTADEIKALKLDADGSHSRLAARPMAVEKTLTSNRSWQALFSTPGRGLCCSHTGKSVWQPPSNSQQEPSRS